MPNARYSRRLRNAAPVWERHVARQLIDRASFSEASAARTIRQRRAPSQSALLRRNAGILDDTAPSVDFALEDGFERCRCRAFLLDRATPSSAKLTKGGSLSAFCGASTNGRKVVNGARTAAWRRRLRAPRLKVRRVGG